MEMSMLGIGVGFDTRGAGRLSIHVPTGEASEFVVPDTREGWCDSVGALLASYFFKGRRPVVFDYSQVRLAGEPIKGFGGTAAGPDPLRDCHVKLNEILSAQSGEPISSTVIADICNLIAKCVVSGNVRRSALIALGNPDDEDYLNLKNYEVNPERMGPDGWGWTSNNSVFAEVDGDYSHLVDLIADNGEPGLFFMDLARSHGRLVDPPNYRDSRIKGCNPCAEQPLEPWEVCTLVETFPHHHESLEDFKQTLKHAYLYGKAVTLMSTHWPETNEVMQRNRRIGTSVSGLAQFVEARGWTELRKWLDDGYQAIKLRDLQYSEWLGVRESIKTTTVKPSGTVSLVAGATPGVHWPVASGTYIRRIRFSNVDPLLQPLLEAGYKAEADVMNPKTTTVVEFPTTGPDVRTETEVSVWEKAELSVLLQRWWSDNMVSCTLTFQGSEVDQLPALVAAKVGQLKTMSMLPIFESGGAYAQMPYERIDPEKAAELQSLAKPMNWEIVYDTALEAEGDRYCTTDKCEIQ
jgi:ribonucleoside-triphosphate reductase